MTAQNNPNADNKATPEPKATGPAASDHVDTDATVTPPAEPTVDAATGDTEQAAAPEAEPPSKKKSKPKAKRSQSRKDGGANPKDKDATKEETDKTAESASSDGSPNLRCLEVVRAAAPVLPSGILPPEIDKMFPDPGSRGALVSALLAAATAAAGHAIGVAGGKDEGQGILGLRVAVVSDATSLASIVAPVLQAAYAVQADEAKIWMAAKQKELGQAAVAAFRQRIYRQVAANAAILGIDGLADAEATPVVMPAYSAVRPCFVLRDPVPTAVKQGLASASKAVLIVDGTQMPTLAGWGRNYLVDLANLLNDANAGELLELADPLAHGAVRMRRACVSVIGMLSTLDTFGLHKAKPEALASTLLVPVEAVKTIAANAAKVLTAMLGRLRALEPEDEGRFRRLRPSSDARKSLEQLKRRLMRATNGLLPPLAGVHAGAADLALRTATALHLLDYAVGNGGQLPTEIENAVVQRAVVFVEQYALPAARSVLEAASIDPVQRDARRVLAFVQQNMTPDEDLTVRELFRHLRRSVGKMELQHAIRLLVDDGLLSPKTPGGSQIYIVHPLVFVPEQRLPDLAGDPRRPKH